MESRVILFGASTMAGFWDRKGGWFSRLREEVDSYQLENEHNAYQMYNCSISGDTSEGLKKRIGTELEARHLERKKIVTLISIGGNDALYLKDRDRNRISKHQFRENLEKIIEIAEKYSDEIVFISGTPMDWEETNPLQWDENKAYRKQDMREYEGLKKRVCRKKDIDYIDLNSKVDEQQWSKMMEDGIHPNTEGHKRMKELIKPELQERGIIPDY